MNKALLFLLFCIFLIGCSNSSFCLKIGGDLGKYGIDDASVELCRNADLSAKENAEIYTSNTGENFVLVNTKYIERANKVIQQANMKESKSIGASEVEPKACMMEEFCQD